MRIRINVTGIVQGVGFRPFVYRVAVQNKLTGYVKNRGDAGVEILLEGPGNSIAVFMQDLRQKKPPLAQIHDVVTKELPGKNKYGQFNIHRSSEEAELGGSVVPPDIAICDDCLREMRDPKDPRFDYFFITCVNCGPRFTLIEHLPYDRENTTMSEFPLCGYCLKEYNDPLNRRFHAQTIACPPCGPKAYLTTQNGDPVICDDPVREAGQLLSEGFILAVKGNGGFHIAASPVLDKPLLALRKTKHRKTKPFAIMARSLEAASSVVEVSSKEAQLLTSFSHPIVLLNKKANCDLSSLIAPGLHNVGVMLPYSGLHYMLFDRVEDKSFVMTSANPPNQPIVKENDIALKTLGDTVDYFLIHNRKIAQRCDDSVVRIHGDRLSFIRRSRGYAPAPIMLNKKAKNCVLALGGELNGTACVLQGAKAFIGQHVGDVENLETRAFLEEASSHLIHLTNSHVDTVACDLHPKFTTSTLAEDLAESNGWNLVRVQHHHAHIAGLMMEHDEHEIVGIACDGYGYGLNGEAWGGEILLGNSGTEKFTRLGHLETQPLLGGDVATRFPLRMAAGILSKKVDIEEWLMNNSQHLPHGKNEVDFILHQLRRTKNETKTSSCGRVLDAVAAVLDLCYERTYEGEPAMKLESAAIKGKNALDLDPVMSGNVLNTTDLLVQIFENRGKCSSADLAYSAHAYLAQGLASLAIAAAAETGIEAVGLTGGVASNEILTKLIRNTVEAAGFRFLVHESVPPGDGGISFGQAIVGGFCSS